MGGSQLQGNVGRDSWQLAGGSQVLMGTELSVGSMVAAACLQLMIEQQGEADMLEVGWAPDEQAYYGGSSNLQHRARHATFLQDT